MRWNHIKTVMIIILLIVNIWLIYLIAGRYMTREFLDGDVIRDTIEILGRSNVYISEDQIDVRKRDADIYTALRGENYFTDVVACFTDSSVDEMLPTPGGMRLVAESGDSFLLGEDFSVTYYAAEWDRTALSELCARAAAEGERISPDGFAFGRAKREIRRLLEGGVSAAGVVSVSHMRAEITEVRHFDGYYLVQCRQTLDGMPLGTNAVSCLCDEKGNMFRLDGVWSFCPPTGSYSAQLYDQINILFIEKAVLDELRDAGAQDGGIHLDSLRLCYVINTAEDGEGGTRVFYSPAWQISYTDGSERIYSAVTGELVDSPA